MTASTLGERLRGDARRLAIVSGEDFETSLRALWQLAEARLGWSAAQRVVREAEPVPTVGLDAYARDCERLLSGEPIAYVLGEQPFHGRLFRVNPAVLIPRPDTEVLVDWALELAAPDRPMKVVDLGTGSGCIAVSLALARSGDDVLAVDASAEAIEVARLNASRLAGRNVRFLVSDWYTALGHERFDLVVSNPPYVRAGDPHLADLTHEPARALVAGTDGLADLRRIVSEAPAHLVPGGFVMVEHGHDQQDAVMELLRAAGFTTVMGRNDLAGRPRVAAGQYT